MIFRRWKYEAWLISDDRQAVAKLPRGAYLARSVLRLPEPAAPVWWVIVGQSIDVPAMTVRVWIQLEP